MKKAFFLFGITVLFFFSCSKTINTFESKYSDIKSEPFKIEFYNSLQDEAFQVNSYPTFVILDKNEIHNAMNEIRNADNPSPWKGAGWNQIKLFLKDTTLTINTNNTVIGFSSSGWFYKLPENNFIKRNLEIK